MRDTLSSPPSPSEKRRWAISLFEEMRGGQHTWSEWMRSEDMIDWQTRKQVEFLEGRDCNISNSSNNNNSRPGFSHDTHMPFMMQKGIRGETTMRRRKKNPITQHLHKQLLLYKLSSTQTSFPILTSLSHFSSLLSQSDAKVQAAGSRDFAAASITTCSPPRLLIEW